MSSPAEPVVLPGDSGPAGPADRDPVALVTLLLAGGAGVALAWSVSRHSLIGARWYLIVLMAVWMAFWVIAARAALAVPGRLSLGVVFVIAVALRLVSVAGTPSISNDLYRYAWDAHVQLSGMDPYRYPPDSPAVAGLRTSGFWPGRPSARICARSRGARCSTGPTCGRSIPPWPRPGSWPCTS